MDLSDLLWRFEGDVGQVWLHGRNEVRVELSNQVVVVLLLRRVGE